VIEGRDRDVVSEYLISVHQPAQTQVSRSVNMCVAIVPSKCECGHTMSHSYFVHPEKLDAPGCSP